MASNEKGTKIKDATHLSSIAGTEKIPVSDGSGTPKHITMADIKTYLAEEYAPEWTDATCAISCTKSGISNTMEVGSDKPATFDFSTSGSTAKAVSAAGAAMGGSLSSSSVVISLSTDSQFVATGIRIYSAGTDVVKSSKGNATNKTASNGTTALDDALVNSNIDATAYTIKQITRSATYVINYVYAIWANTSSISTVAKQSLVTGTQIVLDFPAETSAYKHTFDLPESYTLTKVEVFNTLSNQYEEYNGFSMSDDIEHEDGGGTPVDYERYTRNDGTNGATKFRITFKK